VKGEWLTLIYENIKAISEKRGLSITEVERRANMSKGSISKWKNGNPTINNLQEVAKVLKVKVDTLIKE
jgi:transcriptional regulator with XRE-family HTH domain